MAQPGDFHVRAPRQCLRVTRIQSRIVNYKGNLRLRDAVRKRLRYGLTVDHHARPRPEDYLMTSRPRSGLKLLLSNEKLVGESISATAGLTVLKHFEYAEFQAGASIGLSRQRT
jgi:hypothetical protein